MSARRLGLVACFLLSVATLVARADGPEIIQLHDYVFGKGDDKDLHAEIAYPKITGKKLPAIIYVHGGGWCAGTYKQGNVVAMAQGGYFGASIEYRLSDVAKWPAQIQDCKCAVRWLRANADKFNVDPNRIGVWGDSAGGHLVTCLGTMTDPKLEGDGGWPGVSSTVQAVCNFYGPADLTRTDMFADYATGCMNKLFGATYAKNPALWKSGSPIFNVKAGDPPFLIVQGDSDQIVPLAQQILLEDALVKANVPRQLLIVKNADHGFAPANGKQPDPDAAGILKTVAAFFAKYLQTP